MSTRITNTRKYAFNDEIKIIEQYNFNDDFASIINKQVKQTYTSNINLLQQIQQSIHLLTVRKNDTTNPIKLKKLSDRVQYAILPNQYDNDSFYKITVNNLRNQCHGIPSAGSRLHTFLEGSLFCHMIFYFQFDHIENLLKSRLSNYHFDIEEVLSNRCFIVSNGDYHYPVSLSKLAAIAVWQNQNLSDIIDSELCSLETKFLLFQKLFATLKNYYKTNDWSLDKGQMQYTQNGITRPFDYASLLDDILFARFENRMEEYISYFRVSDLDSSSSFPTVSVRSLVHLKARPQSLSSVENGYAIAAAVESHGKQTPIDWKHKASSRAFSLWLNRSLRHLFRHTYKARVIFASSHSHSTFSLVGEQVATIALFPSLVKGVFETLNLKSPSSVRLIAHNEDVLTIAHDTASWVDINSVNQKASSLFRLVSNDGADPLSLFEQILLPDIGVGTFQLRAVPDNFFELLDTAHTMKHAMPPGHDQYLLGLAFECLHEWGLAVAQFQKALRCDANDPDILHALGCALREIQQIKESLPFLKRAFDLMPEDAEVANNYGQSNLECGLVAEALLAFERAVRLSPGTADYLKNLGNGYLMAARPLDALDMFNKAVRCDPHFAEAHACLAHLHIESGDENLAKKHAMLAYNENPVDANIANMLWRLTLGKK